MKVKPTIQRKNHSFEFEKVIPLKLTVSVPCYEKLEQIDKDTHKMTCYLNGVFSGMGQENNPLHKPSDILTFLGYGSTMNDDIQLHYMSATDYYDYIVKPTILDQLDNAFMQQYRATKDIAKTWDWFYDYFIKNFYIPGIVSYKKELALSDPLSKKFIATTNTHDILLSPDGKTVIIEPTYQNRKE